jgi:steroid delta-isomerase
VPTTAQIEQAMATHFAAWNRGDRDAWMRNLAPDVVLEDPVGGPEKRGREALEKSWDHSFKDGQDWKIEPLFQCICASDAAHLVRSTGRVEGREIVIEGIEVYTIDDAGRIARVRTWFRPPPGEALDPYFSPVGEAAQR